MRALLSRKPLRVLLIISFRTTKSKNCLNKIVENSLIVKQINRFIEEFQDLLTGNCFNRNYRLQLC